MPLDSFLILVSDGVAQPVFLQQRRPPAPARCASRARAARPRNRDRLACLHVGVEAALLGQIADPVAGIARVAGAKQHAVAAVRLDDAQQHAQCRRLAGAVGAQHAVDRATRDGEVDAVDHPALAEGLDQPGGGDRPNRPRASPSERPRARRRRGSRQPRTADQGRGGGAGLRRLRHRARRCGAAGGRAVAAMAGRGAPRRHDLDGGARPPPRQPGRAVARGAQRRRAGDELRARRRPAGTGRRGRGGAHLRLCAGVRLSRRGQARAEGAGPLAGGGGGRAAQGLRRHRAGNGEAAGGGGGAGLAGQAYQSGQPQRRQLAVPGRDLHDAGAGA